MIDSGLRMALNRDELLSDADNAFDAGDYEAALERYTSAAALIPEDVEAMMGLALSLVHLRRHEEAIQRLTALEQFMPESDQLQFMLGETLYAARRLQEAEERLTALIAKSPSYAEAHSRLGRLYMDQDKNPEANACFAATLRLEPDHVEALTCMGLLMIKFCQFDDALTVLRRALARESENVLVLNNLGRACKVMGRHEEALAWLGKGLQIAPANICLINNYLFALNYCAGVDPDFIAAEHFRLGRDYTRPDLPPAERRQSESSLPLRIGYISGDFYTHSVSYFLEPILQNHDYRRFEVFCYSVGSTSDATTDRLKSLPCVWRSLPAMSPEAVAAQVREDSIDILVDLSGHTADNRLGVFACRSAPVQVGWIGYPNTSGIPEMDYYLTDGICDPAGMTERLFSEQLWRLPRTFCCYLPPMQFPPITPSPFTENGFVTFGSFNNFAKVTAPQIALWAKILKQVPDSRLYLKSMALGDRSVKDSVLEKLAAEGIGSERIFMRTVTKTPLEHLQEYTRVDIALDTFPYHGTTTTCEALWMGTPVITMAGATHVSRVGVSILSQIGCTECIACDAEEYVARAVALAEDRSKLDALRMQLREMLATSPLMDPAGVTKEVEEAFVGMFEKCANRNSA